MKERTRMIQYPRSVTEQEESTQHTIEYQSRLPETVTKPSKRLNKPTPIPPSNQQLHSITSSPKATNEPSFETPHESLPQPSFVEPQHHHDLNNDQELRDTHEFLARLFGSVRNGRKQGSRHLVLGFKVFLCERFVIYGFIKPSGGSLNEEIPRFGEVIDRPNHL